MDKGPERASDLPRPHGSQRRIRTNTEPRHLLQAPVSMPQPAAQPELLLLGQTRGLK